MEEQNSEGRFSQKRKRGNDHATSTRPLKIQRNGRDDPDYSATYSAGSRGGSDFQRPSRSEQELYNATKKKDVRFFNQLISQARICSLSVLLISLFFFLYAPVSLQHGQGKRFIPATQAYETLLACGLKPTVYTYTNYINACVRCGEIERAKEILAEMTKNGVAPNEVLYTSVCVFLCALSLSLSLSLSL